MARPMPEKNEESRPRLRMIADDVLDVVLEVVEVSFAGRTCCR